LCAVKVVGLLLKKGDGALSELRVVDGDVLLLEDLPEPRLWLRSLVRQAWPSAAHVVEAVNLQEARESLPSHRFQIALVDWELPDGNAGALTAHLNKTAPETTVIVSTIHDDDERVFAALRAGASGYVLKSQSSERVLGQLRAIERGEPALTPSIANKVLAHFRVLPPAPVGASQPSRPLAIDGAEQLTAREVEVLRLIAKGYRNGEAADLMGISPHTLGGYIKVVYRKLGISCRAEAALEASRLGIAQ
jgi:DNA-binding NarL/FixJ family response regulator